MTVRLASNDKPTGDAATSANRSLTGHKLLMLTPASTLPTPEVVAHLQAKFPGLAIASQEHEFGVASVPQPAAGTDWKWEEITILVTGSALPSRDEAPRLEYVQLLSAGANHVLKNPLFVDTDVTFCTANGVHGPQISEWVVSTFLSFEHHLPRYHDLQKQGKWDRTFPDVQDAVGRRVGVLGYGSIGRQTARLCKALGMDVHAYTLHPRDTPESRRDDTYAAPGTGDRDGVFPSKWFSGGSKEDLHRFLASELDLLVVSTPLTDKTSHLLGAEELEILGKRGTFVSNIARGPIIDTDALVRALQTRQIRGAALDVTDPEPLPEGHVLWGLDNVILTPHVSGASNEYGKRVLAILELNLERLSEGRKLTNRVSRKDGY